jgi:ABC-type maltose transport system permease subunit
MKRLSPILAASWPVILVVVVVLYIATLTEVIVAEIQMVHLRDNGTALMGLKLGIMDKRMLMIPLEISSIEIGVLE